MLMVADVVLQHRPLRFQSRGPFVPAGNFVPLLLEPQEQRAAAFLLLGVLPLTRGDRLFGGLMLRTGEQQLILELRRLLPQLPDGVHPHRNLQRFFLSGQLQKLFCFFRLGAQRNKPPFELREDVPQPEQVFLCKGEPAFRLSLTVAEFGDARRFLKNLPALLGTGRHNFSDAPLPDDRIAVPAEAGVQKKLGNIFQAHLRAVDAVFTVSGAVEPPGNRNFVGIHSGQSAVGVIDVQRHRRHPERLSGLSAAEDDVLHFAAAQSAGRLFAEHPANRVRNVALPRSVGADDGGDAVVEIEPCAVRKGFEALNIERFKPQETASFRIDSFD